MDEVCRRCGCGSYSLETIRIGSGWQHSRQEVCIRACALRIQDADRSISDLAHRLYEVEQRVGVLGL